MTSGTIAEVKSDQPTPQQVVPSPGVGPSGRGVHLPQLDVLRGVAIVGVLLFHCLGCSYKPWQVHPRQLDLPSVLRYPLSCGWAGVSLFFVLSGFVIHYATLGSGSFNIGSFYSRRFFRIYPPYLLALSCFAAIDFHGGLVKHATLFRDVLAHVFVVHNLFSSTYYGINPSFWSLAVEIQFYLLYPLLLLIWRRIGPGKTLLAVLGVSILYRAIGYCITNWAEDVSLPFWLNTPSLWVDWVMGAYLAEKYCNGQKVFHRPLLWTTVFLALFVATDLFKPTSVLSFTVASVLGVIAIEACLHVRQNPRPLFAPLGTLGLCSYSIYLYHQPLLGILYRRGHIQHLSHGSLRFLAIFAIAMLILCPFGHLMYLTVENGSRMLGKRSRAIRVS
jgi:peptidoglycan/LPS O-acetylase OafA/YrhL